MLKYIYIDHKKKNVINGEGTKWPDPKKGCIWLFLTNGSEEEKRKIIKEFEIDPSHIKNYTREIRSKRYSTKPLVFVMVDYFVEKGIIKKTSMLMILKKDLFLTIMPSSFKTYEDGFQEIITYLKEEPKENRNIGEILYDFLDWDLQDNYEVLTQTEEKIELLEKKITEERTQDPDQILTLKRELFRMARIFWATSKIVFLIRKGLVSVDISKKTELMLLDVYNTFQHQIEILETQREMLTDLLTLYETMVSNRLANTSNDLNIIMKKLTSFTVILLIPSLLAGIYGMNFEYLPRAQNTTGFFEMIGMMVLLVGIMYYFFHRRKWL